MPKLYAARTVVGTLKKCGFYTISQKGSHLKMRGMWNGKLQTVIIPMHKELAFGTFRSILKQANMTLEQFEKGLR